jgi:hypothetical protein
MNSRGHVLHFSSKYYDENGKANINYNKGHTLPNDQRAVIARKQESYLKLKIRYPPDATRFTELQDLFGERKKR